MMEKEQPSETMTSSEEPLKNAEKNIAMEKCMLGNAVTLLPQDLCEEESTFFEVMSLDTWENVLTDLHREKLKSLLPSYPENEKEEHDKTLRDLFAGKNFKFGNPLRQFFKKLKDGYMAPEVAKVAKLLRKASYHEYKHQQKCYYYNLLQNVLISRKKLLDAASSLPPNQPVKMLQFTPEPENTAISEVTRLRYFTELHEVREECAEPYTSSEDENYPESIPPKLTRKYRKQMHNLEAPLSPDMSRITSTLTPPHGIHEGSAWSLNCSLYMFEMTEERYREILLRHKQKQTAGQLLSQDHPELDVSNITLQDIITRTNLTKRPVCKQELPLKKKAKTQELVEKKIKPASPPSELQLPDTSVLPSQTKVPLPATFEDSLQATPNSQITGITPLTDGDVTLEEMDVDIDSEGDEIQSHPPRSSTPTKPTTNPSCFFSLVRDLFCDSAEQKLSAAKLDEKIRNWIDGPNPQHCEWLNLQESWCDLALSAIKFLAGDLISILPENFVPYLDYKKKQQQWHWIGAGRDSEENLLALCQHWLENKDDVSLDVLETCQGSPPPPRVVTDWSVRPTTDEEKMVYREQECIRYQKPHKAFTFQIHGYESVVGPVKGVYGKESGVNKAREHSLLVSDRPPFVTILSLVRDSAARLPNGEGTRADICELLKDSQYLAPALDQQIHAVVSGALDRLHYEKDPCVKYDVNRKLWIYLHRSRTEEEFERIHQAQAAAAKAKKAFQKTKMPRVKTKDVSQGTPTSGLNTLSGESPSTVVNTEASSNGIVSSTSSPSLSSPRGGTNPRSVGPTKQGNPRTLVRSLSLPVQSNTKTMPPATVDVAVQSNTKKQISTTSTGTLFSAASAVITSVAASSSPKHMSASSILPQPQNEGSNSRPPSQGSVQSLPSPKTVIANVNAAQFVGVAPLQGSSSSVDQSLPSPEATQTPPPVVTDIKPSSPAFVSQSPVLQPVINQAAISMCPTLTSSVSSVTSSLAKVAAGPPTKRLTSTATIAQALSSTSPVQGFQTIVIKPDPGGKPGTSISTLPLLATGSVASSGKTAVVSTKPVVARVMSGTQVVSLSNLVAGNTSSVAKGATGAATFRIQGGNFVQPVVTAASLNVLQATHLTAASSAKLPRLAVASQQNVPLTTVSSASTMNPQPKLITVTQGQLGILQAAHLDTAVSHDASGALSSDSKTMVLSPQKQLKTLTGLSTNNPQTAGGQVIGKPTQTVVMTPKSATPVNSVSLPTNTTLPSVILASNSSVTSPTVVIATQGALRPSSQTYVMAAPGTTPAVVMTAASQQGIKGVTPLNVKTLQGIKVIPVPPNVGGTKGVRTQPLLARIIAPPTGVTLQPGGTVATVSAGLGQTQQVTAQPGVNIVSGIASAASHPQVAQRCAAKPTAVSLSTTSSQPVIVQVQTSTVGSHSEPTEQ